MHSFWIRPELDRPDQLNTAIQQLHFAAQPIAAVGQSLLPHAPDDSHTNLEWLPDRNLLAGDTIDDRIRIGLQFQSFSLCVADRDGASVTAFALDGKTLAQCFGWLKQQLDLQGFAGGRLQPIDHYTLPDHPIGRGTPFRQPEEEVLHQVCIGFHNAYGLLTGLAKRHTPEASGVRIWPHHFDMSTLIEIRRDGAGDPSARIGIGLATADAIADEPYYYVSPWQRSEPLPFTDAPPLVAGRWQTEEFRGAVLPWSAIPGSASAEQQQRVVETDLEVAIQYCRERLK